MKSLATILLLSITFSVFGQVTFQKVYEKLYEDCSSIQPTSDGGYILSATKRNTNGFYEIALLKLNSIGSLSWTKTFGGIGFTMGQFAQQTNDGGFIICGNNQPNMAGIFQIYIIKVNSSGNLLWSKTYGGSPWSSYESYQIKQTTDKGYIVVGSSNPNYLGYPAAFLMKLNSSGDTSWTKAFAGRRGSLGYSVEQTVDGGYVMAGLIMDSLTSNITNAFIVKTNSVGQTLWTKSIGGTFNNCKVSAFSIKQTLDGGFIITGKTNSFGAGNDDIFLTKTDIYGNPNWTKIFGGIYTDRGVSVIQTLDGGYAVAGYTFSFGNSSGEYYLIKTNSVGDTLWTRSFGSSSYNYAHGMIQTSDGGYILAGESGGFGSYGIYVVKTDANGHSGCYENSTQTSVSSPILNNSNLPVNFYSGVSVSLPITILGNSGLDSTLCLNDSLLENNQTNLIIEIFPNPFHSNATLIIKNKLQNIQLNIYNSFGQLVKRQIINSQVTMISRDGLADGIYFFQLTNDDKVLICGKLVIE